MIMILPPPGSSVPCAAPLQTQPVLRAHHPRECLQARCPHHRLCALQACPLSGSLQCGQAGPVQGHLWRGSRIRSQGHRHVPAIDGEGGGGALWVCKYGILCLPKTWSHLQVAAALYHFFPLRAPSWGERERERALHAVASSKVSLDIRKYGGMQHSIVACHSPLLLLLRLLLLPFHNHDHFCINLCLFFLSVSSCCSSPFPRSATTQPISSLPSGRREDSLDNTHH